ncbi:50S ribosomal protein L21 [Thelohanellus kitauei]|uniref:Large ribosomal subunit protein bL21m n=1 Tax=Thelohanellus kitauei TaxID=669202 RepID=A0A0C2MIE0_THEKT|nr:50S ribosomal protein L21 [Thelohanellus kitauei]
MLANFTRIAFNSAAKRYSSTVSRRTSLLMFSKLLLSRYKGVLVSQSLLSNRLCSTNELKSAIENIDLNIRISPDHQRMLSFGLTSYLALLKNEIKCIETIAVICFGGRQFIVRHGDTIIVNEVHVEPGTKMVLGKVLLVAGQKFTMIGKPLISLDTVKVNAEVVEHFLGPIKKTYKFQKKSTRRYRESRHRFTVIKIQDIEIDENSLKEFT